MGKIGLSSIFLAAIALLPPLSAASDRVMIGDDIYVGPNEDLGEVVCILCSVHIDGRVDTAVSVLGGLVVEGEVREEAVSILGGLDIPGAVGGDVVSVLGAAKVEGQVGGDLAAILGSLDMGPNARVEGDVASILSSVSGLGDATVIGEVDIREDVAPFAKGLVYFVLASVFIGCLLTFALTSFLAAIIFGEARTEILRDTVANRAGMSFLVGLGVMFVSVVVISILVWFFPPVVFVPFVLAAFGYAGICLAIARVASASIRFDAGAALGAVIVAVLQFVPVVGWLLGSVLFFIAVGAPVVSGFGSSVDWLIRRSEPEPIQRPLPSRE